MLLFIDCLIVLARFPVTFCSSRYCSVGAAVIGSFNDGGARNVLAPVFVLPGDVLRLVGGSIVGSLVTGLGL